MSCWQYYRESDRVRNSKSVLNMLVLSSRKNIFSMNNCYMFAKIYVYVWYRNSSPLKRQTTNLAFILNKDYIPCRLGHGHKYFTRKSAKNYAKSKTTFIALVNW